MVSKKGVLRCAGRGVKSPGWMGCPRRDSNPHLDRVQSGRLFRFGHGDLLVSLEGVEPTTTGA